jgi:anti-sigma regulatory factor (Ser/Thr protein kinase)
MVCHVLLVREKASRVISLHRALCQRDFIVTPSSDAQHALAWARQRQPDLILLAGPTADLSADQLCLSLKLQRSTNLLPVVLVRDNSSRLALRVEPDAELCDPTCPLQLSRAVGCALTAREEAVLEGTVAEVRFLLPSDSDRLEEMLRHLAPWLSGCGLNSHSVQQMTLAVREVGANAIEWGHCHQRERFVSVHCRLDADKVSVLVRDSGNGFDPRNLPHAARRGDPLSHLKVRAERNLRDGGFGILMASGLVDHLVYNEAGNEAQLLKFLPLRTRTPVAALAETAPEPVRP